MCCSHTPRYLPEVAHQLPDFRFEQMRGIGLQQIYIALSTSIVGTIDPFAVFIFIDLCVNFCQLKIGVILSRVRSDGFFENIIGLDI